MENPWVIERKERAGDPDALAAIVVDTDLVLASDLRAVLRVELEGFPDEQPDVGTTDVERRGRMHGLLVSLDRRLGEKDYVADGDRYFGHEPFEPAE